MTCLPPGRLADALTSAFSALSACLLGWYWRSAVAMPRASRPGTSSAAMRAGYRMTSMNRARSCATAQPAPKKMSARFLAVMCGTPNESRTIVRPGFGCSVLTAAPVRPNVAGLKYFGMSAAVTEPSRGVSPSYSASWSVEFGTAGSEPAWPGGRMFHA